MNEDIFGFNRDNGQLKFFIPKHNSLCIKMFELCFVNTDTGEKTESGEFYRLLLDGEHSEHTKDCIDPNIMEFGKLARCNIAGDLLR